MGKLLIIIGFFCLVLNQGAAEAKMVQGTAVFSTPMAEKFKVAVAIYQSTLPSKSAWLVVSILNEDGSIIEPHIKSFGFSNIQTLSPLAKSATLTKFVKENVFVFKMNPKNLSTLLTAVKKSETVFIANQRSLLYQLKHAVDEVFIDYKNSAVAFLPKFYEALANLFLPSAAAQMGWTPYTHPLTATTDSLLDSLGEAAAELGTCLFELAASCVVDLIPPSSLGSGDTIPLAPKEAFFPGESCPCGQVALVACSKALGMPLHFEYKPCLITAASGAVLACATPSCDGGAVLSSYVDQYGFLFQSDENWEPEPGTGEPIDIFNCSCGSLQSIACQTQDGKITAFYESAACVEDNTAKFPAGLFPPGFNCRVPKSYCEADEIMVHL